MRLLNLVLLIFLISCNNKKDTPDISNINANITIHRFDKDFFSMDTTKLPQSLQVVGQKYPAFLSLYFKFFAPVNEMAQEQNISFNAALLQYFRAIKPLYLAADKKFNDVSAIEKNLATSMRYVKHYFPGFKIPVVLASVESLNPENQTEIYGTTYYRDTLIISLQMFLGRDYPVYDPTQYPDYLRRRFEPAYIVPNSIRAITSDVYTDSSQSASLIEQMIEKGKLWWLMKEFLPGSPDSLITGFSAQQMAWCQKEEGNIWGSVNQTENLFTIEPTTIQGYIGESPFTQTLPHGNNGEGAPGNIGPWIGWQIIKKFEDRNSKLTVSEILRTTAKKIFEEAKYKPK